MKFLITLFFLVFSLYGKTIDKIKIIVNDEIITSYDISQIEKQMGISEKDAEDFLINQAVLKSAIKDKGIFVDDFDIDNEMQKIAQKNGMSLFNFKNYLLQKGDLDKLKAQIKLKLERDKLLQSLNIRVDENDVKQYYNLNKNQFLIPSTIDVTEYSSINKENLIEVIKNPLTMNGDVEIKDKKFDSNNTNPRLLEFLNQTKIDNFTPIITINSKFRTFYIKSKGELKPLPLKIVEMQIYQKLVNEKNQKTLEDFISKLKAKADIQLLN